MIKIVFNAKIGVNKVVTIIIIGKIFLWKGLDLILSKTSDKVKLLSVKKYMESPKKAKETVIKNIRLTFSTLVFLIVFHLRQFYLLIYTLLDYLI